MEVEEKFVSIATLICEPSKAKMLLSLLNGRAHIASELALVANLFATSASDHLSKILEAKIVKVKTQGRHRYFSFSNPEVAYVIEALANLSGNKVSTPNQQIVTNGIKYCRTC